MPESHDIIAQTLGLPWNIQIAVASGYAAYLFAYKGIRQHHQTVDVAFSTLAFSAIATASLWLLNMPKDPVRAGAEAFCITMVAALIWRKALAPFVGATVRILDISWSNDDPSALDTLAANSKNRISQVSVLLNDGTWLRCDDTSKFKGAPFSPYVLGKSGDIAFYLTHERKPEEPEARELKTVRTNYGDRITYIPASSIKLLNIRYESKINRFQKAAAWLRSLFGYPSVGRKHLALVEPTLEDLPQDLSRGHS